MSKQNNYTDEEKKQKRREADTKYRLTEHGQAALKRRLEKVKICPKTKAYQKKWREENKDLSKQWRKDYVFKRYGITHEFYLNLLKEQNNLCALCGLPNTEINGFSIDHDHNCCPGDKCCGKCVRGLIHGKCNRALGLFEDSKERLALAQQYLQRYEDKPNK